VLERRRFIVGAALIAAAVSYLVWAGIRSSSMYYLEIDEFVARQGGLVGETLRVKGWVRQGTMQWDARTNDLVFQLAPKDGSGGAVVPVSYRGVLPDMFAEGREVVVEARWQDGALHARQIMTSCPSKYEPADATQAEAKPAPAAGT
jgi:cytochrome c-type biogenesis protein CcmE